MGCDGYCQAWWGTWWPWAEANQGLLSVAALIIALVLFLLEQRRANMAEGRAKGAAMRAELKELEDRRIAKAEARAAANGEKRRRVSEYVATTSDILEGFVQAGREAAEDSRRTSVGFNVVADEIVGALHSLEGICPGDAALLRLLHRAIGAVKRAAAKETMTGLRAPHLAFGSGPAFVDAVEDELNEIVAELRARQKALAQFWS